MSEQATKEIYQNSCAQIASQLEVYGFKYFKSGPKLKKVSGDLTYEISFSTSMYNSKGYQVAIDSHAWVKSKKLKKWRLTQPQCKNMKGEVTDVAAHSHIRYLSEKRVIGKWNLIDPSNRESVIGEIVEVIVCSVFPFFEKFDDPNLIANELIESHAEGLGMDYPSSFIEYALCFLSDELAKEIVISYLKRVLESKRVYDGLEDFKDAYEDYREMDVPEDHRPRGHANEIAYYSVKYDWGNVSEGIA